MNTVNTKWNLKEIYENNNLFEEDIQKLKNELNNFKSHEGKVCNSSLELFNTLNDYCNLINIFEKLYVFASSSYNLDSLNNENALLKNKINDLISYFDEKVSFLATELAKLNLIKLDKYIEEEPKLKTYQYYLTKIIKNKKHILSKKEEKILSSLDIIRSANKRIFDKLNDTDVLFNKIEDKELTHANYSLYIRVRDDNLRKNAFINYHEYYKNHANTIAECLITQIKNNQTEATIRHYQSPLAMSLNEDNINPKLYDKLIKSVHKNISLFYEYLDLKKQVNNLKEMHMYDVYLPMTKITEHKYTFEEGINEVFNSLKIMGEDYLNVAEKCMSESWIDAYESKGKTSGAYSSGSYNTKPYILLNYTEDLNGVETIAHELGHSIHSYYSNKNQDYINANYPIFLAEIASNTHELLLFNYLLNNTEDKKIKQRILEIILESFKGSVYRQTQFAEFEKGIHEMDNLTKDNIVNYYSDLNKFYYGKNVINDELIKYECLRIPHFYSSFYVYKYAIGLMIAYIFAGKIIANEDGAIDNYIKFISSGGSNDPLEILKLCGIDLIKSDIIDESFKIFENYLKEYKELVGCEK